MAAESTKILVARAEADLKGGGGIKRMSVNACYRCYTNENKTHAVLIPVNSPALITALRRPVVSSSKNVEAGSPAALLEEDALAVGTATILMAVTEA